MTWPRLICLILTLCLGGTAFKAIPVAAAKDVWISVRSKHFTLIGNAGEDDVRKAAAKLEQFRAAVSGLFDHPRRSFTPPITVVVFKDDLSYTPFKPLYQGKPTEVSGYFQSSNDAIYITLAANRHGVDPYSIIFHEYTHFLTGEGAAPLPAWLAEGLAEYYSTFEAASSGRKIVVGGAIPARVRLLREENFLPLATLFSVNHDSPFYIEADKKNVFYAESWALVHYLMAGSNGKYQPQFRQFLTLLAGGLAEGQSGEEVFKRTFQTDLKEFESALRQYLRRSHFVPQQIALDQKIEFDPAMQAAPLSDAETSACLGDLLWHVHRDEEGEAALQHALMFDPQLVSAHTSLGLLRVRQKRYAEARDHLQHAVNANSANALAHYYYAFAWQQEYVEAGYVSHFTPEAVQGMRASLNRVRELAPEFADTYKALAFINLVLREDLEEAEFLLKHALKLEPKREDFAYTLAQVYTRRQNYAAARLTAEKIVREGEKPDIRDRARFLLEAIARREEDLARAKVEEEARLREQASQPKNTDDPTKLPGKRFQGEQVRGLLTRIECADEFIVLTVVSGVRAFKFRAELSKLTFVRHTMEIPNQITCGAMVPARQVIVTYHSATNAKLKIDGEPVGVEFLKPGDD